MEEFDYASILPTEPPKGLIGWLYNNNAFNGDYIIYRHEYEYNPLTDMKEKAVRCRCTACEREFIQSRAEAYSCCQRTYSPVTFGFLNELTGETVYNGYTTVCPYCGTEVKVYHVSSISKTGTIINEKFPLTVDNIDGNLVIFIWHVCRKVYKDGLCRIDTHPYEAYVIQKRKIVRLTGYSVGMFGNCYFNSGWEQRKRFKDGCGEHYKERIYPFDASVLNGTVAENCKLDIYLNSENKTYPVAYMRLWTKHNNVENLVTSGMTDFINYKLYKSLQSYYESPQISRIKGINWKENKPNLMIGLTKEEFRYIKKKKFLPEQVDYYIAAKVGGARLEDVEKLQKKISIQTVKSLVEYKVNILHVMRYIEKQKKKDAKAADIISISYLLDYWDMAKNRGADLSDDKIQYPHKLRKAHDEEIRLIKITQNPSLEEPFKKRYNKLKKFCFEFGNLSIHPAKSEREMILEGKILNHCVGSYVKRHAEGKTSIFFIRYISYPEEPYFTLELDLEKVRVIQNRGFKNCDRTEEVSIFEKEWLKFVNEIKKKKKNRKAA